MLTPRCLAVARMLARMEWVSAPVGVLLQPLSLLHSPWIAGSMVEAMSARRFAIAFM